MTEDGRTFKDTVNYPQLILSRVNDIQLAIHAGQDGTVQLTNLLAILTKRILGNGTLDKINAVLSDLKVNTEKLMKEYEVNRTVQEWNRMQETSMQLNRESMQHIISIVINRLDEPDVNFLADYENRMSSALVR